MNENAMKHGGFGWFELMTTDVARAKEFYGKLFGWNFSSMPMDEGEAYEVVSHMDEQVAGIMSMPSQVPENMPPMWVLYVTVNNVDETAQLAVDMGGAIVVPPTDIPQIGRFAVIADPQGGTINVITYVPWNPENK